MATDQIVMPTFEGFGSTLSKGAAFLGNALHLLGNSVSKLLGSAANIFASITNGTAAFNGTSKQGLYNLTKDVEDMVQILDNQKTGFLAATV